MATLHDENTCIAVQWQLFLSAFYMPCYCIIHSLLRLTFWRVTSSKGIQQRLHGALLSVCLPGVIAHNLISQPFCVCILRAMEDWRWLIPIPESNSLSAVFNT